PQHTHIHTHSLIHNTHTHTHSSTNTHTHTHTHTPRTGKLLDSASDVVDDVYSGCRQKAMERFILSGLLGIELNSSAEYQKAWRANDQCVTLINGGTKEHTTALLTYSNGDRTFIDTFDNAVETKGGNVSIYENQFHFKSLHFLLMDAMMLLKPKTCQTVFVIQENEGRHSSEQSAIPKKGSTVRFGSFTSVTSSFEDLKKDEDLDEQVVLNITSCFYFNIGEHICSEDKHAVLLSPAEDFTVEDVLKKSEDDSEYTEVVLKHLSLNSTHNCFLFSR
uniref:NAD(P)(+)--arginine ADP-ribosyltransferase n=1 Tax=Gouania willdenowi TaxID=441366 RepID=A0A8C5DFI6_GOUWI